MFVSLVCPGLVKRSLAEASINRLRAVLSWPCTCNANDSCVACAHFVSGTITTIVRYGKTQFLFLFLRYTPLLRKRLFCRFGKRPTLWLFYVVQTITY